MTATVLVEKMSSALPELAPILRTRIQTPAISQEFVERARLKEKLDRNIDRCATLVVAPAGYGKTCLLAAWAQQQEVRPIWVALEEEDNEPLQFLAYLVAAFQMAAGARDLLPEKRILETYQRGDRVQAMTEFANAVAAHGVERWVLVLDHYGLVHSEDVHRTVSFLLDYLGQSLHTVLITRRQPPLELSRMRACARLSEITALELEFTEGETNDFFEAKGISFSDGQVRRVRSRVGGWVAGLQTVAHAERVLGAERSLTEVLDRSQASLQVYFDTQVLNDLTPAARKCLERASVLEWLDEGLLRGLWADETIPITLDEQTAQALFLDPHVGRPSSYRLQPALRTALRRRLEASNPEILPDLHIRAARLHEARGEPGAAVRQWLEATEAQLRLAAPGQAREVLERALQVAERAGVRRPFFETSRGVAMLLTRLVGSDGAGSAEGFAASLIDRSQILATQKQDGWPEHLEPLTEREREVMDLLAAGRKSREIAEDLVISPHTARTHIKNIYRKLDVHSRTEAVARARELGLLL